MYSQDIEIATKESRNLPSELVRFKQAFLSMNTFNHYFESLRKDNKLSVADIQRRSISIKVNLHAKRVIIISCPCTTKAHFQQNISSNSDEELDLENNWVPAKRGKKKQRASGKKRHMVDISDADSMEVSFRFCKQ
ncbi:MAG TPA: hypothetical protein VGO47_14645 [Chlamydiales bacterium]|nr:hypothetical protein [Chlamydiales bacterium]